jgi:hypothetical protein
MTAFSLLAGALLLSPAMSSSEADKLAWLEGSWRGTAFGGTIEETFVKPAGGVVLGLSRIVGSEDRLIHKEFMEIGLTEGKLTYTVTLPNKKHTFALHKLEGQSVTWTDPANDFPSRITYSRSQDTITVLLEGKGQGGAAMKETIVMQKIKPGS